MPASLSADFSAAKDLPSPSRVVPTKLGPPRLRERLIERPELVERLREGREHALTLVCAPAGYGKTTLLAQWASVDRERTPFVWISLDEHDSDPARLWSHLIAGLRQAYEPAGESSLEPLTAGAPAILGTVLPLLIEELSGSPPLVLILEDWHAVRNALCTETVSFFVERAPTGLQVVISSRSDPGLPVSRLRAHGELTEVRAEDLRVSAAEASRLFREVGVRLAPSDVERLTQRTEGWLAGLSLAALAVKKQEDPRRFVSDFSGTTRHVLDYLAQDVLQAVAPEVRDFLVRTSVLDRLTAALCNAVLETSSSATMLAEVERANLFLVSLDESGTEYRYHQLFKTMLLRELEATDAAAVPGLHSRASEWFEATGEVELAIQHAIAGYDVPRASRLVVRHGPMFWTSGRVATVARWLEVLSWPEAVADRQLALVRAQILGLTGHGRDDVERWLEIAEAGPDTGPLANGLASLRSGVAILRSAYLTRGLEAAEREARLALELQPRESPWRGPILVLLGQALYLLGRSEDARAFLEEACEFQLTRELAPVAMLGLAYLALAMLDAGDRARPERIARDALAHLEERHLSSGPAAANPHLALGCALAKGSDLHSAIDHLECAVELTAPAGATYWHVHALLRLASARHRLGDARNAKEVLARAMAGLDELPDRGMLGGLCEETRDDLLSRQRREGFRGDGLSDAELRILRRFVEGMSVAEVAQELWLSPNTVKTHRRSIYRKLGVKSRDELLDRAATIGVVASEPETRPNIAG
jgi:LuxR family maltose regulon positive regulatory protein